MIKFSLFVLLVVSFHLGASSQLFAFGRSYCRDLDGDEQQIFREQKERERRKGFEKQLADAKEYLDKIEVRDNYAIIFDIDGTSVDLVRDGVNFTTRAVPEIFELYQFALKKKFKVFFLTGRPVCTLRQIRSLLHSHQYTTFSGIIAAPMSVYRDTLHLADNLARKRIALWKEDMRRSLTYYYDLDIVMTVDDFSENLEGDFAGYRFLIPSR